MTDQKRTTSEMVREFHEAFAQRFPEPGPPSLTNELIGDRVHLRMDLIAEEFFELVGAVYGDSAERYIAGAWNATKQLDDGSRDVVGAADALGDMDYVITGMAIEANIPHDAVVETIHASNMSKLGEDGLPVMSDGETPDPRDGKIKPKGKILKGPNFFEPDIAAVLGLAEEEA